MLPIGSYILTGYFVISSKILLETASYEILQAKQDGLFLSSLAVAQSDNWVKFSGPERRDRTSRSSRIAWNYGTMISISSIVWFMIPFNYFESF